MFTVDGGEENRVEFGMTPINTPYPPTEDVLQARQARAKTCVSDRGVEGDLESKRKRALEQSASGREVKK